MTPAQLIVAAAELIGRRTPDGRSVIIDETHALYLTASFHGASRDAYSTARIALHAACYPKIALLGVLFQYSERYCRIRPFERREQVGRRWLRLRMRRVARSLENES